MSIDKKLFSIIAVCILSTSVFAVITDGQIKQTDFFNLLDDPESTEEHLVKKLSFELENLFGLSYNGASYEDLLKAYVTGGYDFEQRKLSPADLENEFLNKLESFKADFQRSFTCQTDNADIVSKENMMKKILNIKNIYYENIQTRTRYAAYNKLNDIASKHNFANDTGNLVIGVISKSNDNYNALIGMYNQSNNKPEQENLYTSINVLKKCVENLNGISNDIKKEIVSQNDTLSQVRFAEYLHRALNFEFLYTKSMATLQNDFLEEKNPGSPELKSFARKMYTFINIFGSNPRNVDSKIFNSIKQHIYSILSFKLHEGSSTVFDRTFNELVDMKAAENKHLAFIINGLVSRNLNILTLYCESVEECSEEYVRFKTETRQKLVLGYVKANVMIRMFKDQEMQKNILIATLNFIASSIKTNEVTFAKLFDLYLDTYSQIDPVYVNIIKYLIAYIGKSTRKENNWESFKVLKIVNWSLYDQIIQGSEKFKMLLNSSYIKKFNREASEYREIFAVNEFEMEWIPDSKFEIQSQTETTEVSTVKLTGVNYNSGSAIGDLNLHNQPLQKPQYEPDNGLDEDRRNKFNQRQGKYDPNRVGDDEGEEDIEEDNPLKGSTSPHKIDQYQGSPENMINFIQGNLSQKAIDQLKEPGLYKKLGININGNQHERDGIADNTGVKYNIDGFDDVVVVTVIPYGSDCYNAVRAYIDQQQH